MTSTVLQGAVLRLIWSLATTAGIQICVDKTEKKYSPRQVSEGVTSAKHVDISINLSQNLWSVLNPMLSGLSGLTKQELSAELTIAPLRPWGHSVLETEKVSKWLVQWCKRIQPDNVSTLSTVFMPLRSQSGKKWENSLKDYKKKNNMHTFIL